VSIRTLGALLFSGGLISTAVGAALVIVGTVRLRRDTTAAYRWFHRTLLINLLFTRVFQFNVEQFLATASVVVDVIVLAAVSVTLSHLEAELAAHAADPSTTPAAMASARRL